MRHTNLFEKYEALDAQERRELAAAVNAHGGDYIFPTQDEDGCDPRTIVSASFKHSERTDDYTVTRVKVQHGVPIIYGCPVGSEDNVGVLYYIEYGHISFITDVIPETDDVKDVSESVK